MVLILLIEKQPSALSALCPFSKLCPTATSFGQTIDALKLKCKQKEEIANVDLPKPNISVSESIVALAKKNLKFTDGLCSWYFNLSI